MPALRSRTNAQAVEQFPVIIIGGGICGLLAAERCLRDGIQYLLFERGDDFGGNWVVRANTYSHLQASYETLDCSTDAQQLDSSKAMPRQKLLNMFTSPIEINRLLGCE